MGGAGGGEPSRGPDTPLPHGPPGRRGGAPAHPARGRGHRLRQRRGRRGGRAPRRYRGGLRGRDERQGRGARPDAHALRQPARPARSQPAHAPPRTSPSSIGRLLDDYPASRPLLGGATFVYRGRVYSRNIPLFRDPGGVQALKTGFTREAGYNLAISAWKSGQQFVLIVLGSQTRSLSFRDAKAILRYGFYETGLEAAPSRPRRRVDPRSLPGARLSAARARPCPGPARMAAPPRLRLRRLRDAVRRPLGGGGGARGDLGPAGALPALAPEAARVHVAALADGPLRGLLGGDRSGPALRAAPARRRRERVPDRGVDGAPISP